MLSKLFCPILQSCLHSTIPFNKNTHDQLSDKDKEVLKYAKTNGSVTRAQITSLLVVSISEAARILKRLTESNLLHRRGKGRSTSYIVVE